MDLWQIYVSSLDKNYKLKWLGVADEIELEDFEDCLVDFMLDNFNVMIEDNSAKEVKILLKKFTKNNIIIFLDWKSIDESEKLINWKF